jgi:hypothetical protein
VVVFVPVGVVTFVSVFVSVFVVDFSSHPTMQIEKRLRLSIAATMRFIINISYFKNNGTVRRLRTGSQPSTRLLSEHLHHEEHDVQLLPHPEATEKHPQSAGDQDTGQGLLCDEPLERPGAPAHPGSPLFNDGRGVLLNFFELLAGDIFGNGAHSLNVVRHDACLFGQSLARRSIVSGACDGTFRGRGELVRSHDVPFSSMQVAMYRETVRFSKTPYGSG